MSNRENFRICRRRP